MQFSCSVLSDRRVAVRLASVLALSTVCDIKRLESIPVDWSHFLDPMLQMLAELSAQDPDHSCRVLCAGVLSQLRNMYSEEELHLLSAL